MMMMMVMMMVMILFMISHDFSELPNFLFLIHASDIYFLKLWCLFELSNQCLRMVG